MSQPSIIPVLQAAGFTGDALKAAYAIVMRESGGRPDAFNGNTGTGDRSWGLFQINTLGPLKSRVQQYGLTSERDLLDPVANAKAAYQLSKGGTDFGAWGIGPNAYRSGAGFDTIKKFYDAFPGPTTTPAPAAARRPATGPTTPSRDPSFSTRSRFFADKVKTGEWSVGSSLSKTVSLTREFNRAYANQPIPASPNLKYPRLTGTLPAGDASLIVNEAYKWLGTPYSWGGGGVNGPSLGSGRGAKTVGFDCSSFLQYLWAKKGVQIPRVTYDQWRTGTPVATKDLQPGDAVFFHPGPRGPEHVGMYIGNGKYINAPKTGDVIKISTLAGRTDLLGARRYGQPR